MTGSSRLGLAQGWGMTQAVKLNSFKALQQLEQSLRVAREP